MHNRFVVATALAAVLAMASTGAFAKPAKAFIEDAIKGDNSEIMLGQVAQDKGSSAAIKEFGAMLVTDHTKAKEEASAVAKTLGVIPPESATAEADKEKTKLMGLSGPAFDHEFATYMVKDHKKDIMEFEAEAKAKAGATSTLAEKQLPDLKKHLSMAETLGKSAQK